MTLRPKSGLRSNKYVAGYRVRFFAWFFAIMEQTKTIKTDNGELYVQGDKIIGRMEIEGNITRYYRGDKLHRDGTVLHGEIVSDLPAYIKRNKAGDVICEAYWRDGKEHRDGDLPAYIERNDAQCFAKQSINQCFASQSINQCFASQSINGVVTYEVYYRDGVEFSKAAIKLTDELAAEKATSLALREELAALKAKLLMLIN